MRLGNGRAEARGKMVLGLKTQSSMCYVKDLLGDDYLHFGSSYFFFPSYEFLFWGLTLEFLLTSTLLTVT